MLVPSHPRRFNDRVASFIDRLVSEAYRVVFAVVEVPGGAGCRASANFPPAGARRARAGRRTAAPRGRVSHGPARRPGKPRERGGEGQPPYRGTCWQARHDQPGAGTVRLMPDDGCAAPVPPGRRRAGRRLAKSPGRRTGIRGHAGQPCAAAAARGLRLPGRCGLRGPGGSPGPGCHGGGFFPAAKPCSPRRVPAATAGLSSATARPHPATAIQPAGAALR